MTKDGFAILAMGFTGKKAMRFKEAYIRRFNEMDQFTRSLQVTKMEFPAFTEAVLMAHEEPKQQIEVEADCIIHKLKAVPNLS